MIEYRVFFVTINTNVSDMARPHIDFLFEPDIPFEWNNPPVKLNLDGLIYHKWEIVSIFDVQDYGKVALCKRTN